jgi:FkbM family methyltransferase
MENYLKKMLEIVDFTNGFYIECGANDGISQSYTYELEKRNWKGILIEPSIYAFNKCIENRSPNNIFVNCALGSKDGKVSGDFYGSLMSSVDGIRLNNDNLIEVEIKKLTTILEEYEINKIDLFSLDVEGYELEVLKGLDLIKYKPTYLIIEIYSKDYNEIVKYLSSFDYELIEGLTNYNKIDNPNWDETHNDYIFKYVPFLGGLADDGPPSSLRKIRLDI